MRQIERGEDDDRWLLVEGGWCAVVGTAVPSKAGPTMWQPKDIVSWQPFAEVPRACQHDATKDCLQELRTAAEPKE